MKWPIVGLFALGFAAAVCAAVLVASLQSKRSPVLPRIGVPQPDRDERDDERTILVAARDLDAMAVIGADDITSKTVALSVVPEGARTDPVQVVGKLLRFPVTAGQAFTVAHFASEGSAIHLASALTTGKRAVSIALSDSMGIEPLLYPGSTVDVLASISVDANDGLGAQRASITILQRVQVLAVGHETVAATTRQEDEGSPLSRGPRPMVTLLLSPEQAETLKLAQDEGSISLTLRNPMDDRPVDPAGTRMSEISPMFAAIAERTRREAAAAREREAEKASYEMERARFGIERDRREIEIARAKLEAEQFQEEQKMEATIHPQWQTIILRGGVAETKTFDLPANGGKK